MPKIEYVEDIGMGAVTFIKRADMVNGTSYGIFLCNCGNEFRARIHAVKSGKTKSCGCLQLKVASTIKNIYNNGDKIGNCTYLNDAPYKPGFPRKANFTCQCGNIFTTAIQSVNDGSTKSCGCLTSSLLSESGSLPQKKMPTISDEDRDRFWSKVGFTANPEKCWNWTASGQRYGNFSIKGSQFKSNRLAYYIANSVDPKELSVLHSCDNPKCCNPSHLYLGTHYENMQDMAKKNRAYCGERMNTAKLKDEDVIQIKKLFKDGINRDNLSKQFSISKTSIGLILRGVTWKHIL